MKAPPNKHKTSASGRSKLDLPSRRFPTFPVRMPSKAPVAAGWQSSPRTPAGDVAVVPGYGVAMSCENFLVLDIDGRTGMHSMGALIRKHGGLSPTYKQRTPHGGHVVFLAPAGVSVPNSVGKLGPGLDVRAAGGYAICWPTPGYVPLRDVEPLEPNEWLVRLAAGGSRRARTEGTTGTQAHSIGGLTMTLANAQQGTRNDVLHWCLCRAAEMPAGKQRSALRAIRNEARMIGLGDYEIERTIGSVFGGRRG